MTLLIFGTIHLLLLIVSIYLLAFFQLYYSVRVSAADALLLLVQILNLPLLVRYLTGYDAAISLLLAWQSILLALILWRLVLLLRKLSICRKLLLLPHSIRESIDSLPGGICFATLIGRPILTNRRMNELAYRLTGSMVINARNTWLTLTKGQLNKGCSRLEDPWLSSALPEGADGDYLFFSLSGGSIWRFHREALTDRFPHYVQLEATDITELYQYSAELYQNNQRLAAQFSRQQNLLANIVEINHEKEVLQAKMRIHDELGRTLLSTKQHLENDTLDENMPYLAELWNRTIRSLEDFSQIDTEVMTSPEIELQRAADMIGCRINFQGERSLPRKTAVLLYAMVREALTNAVLHANANQLDVMTTRTDRRFHVEISDNGKVSVDALQEGGGLCNLRRRLEQEGATLTIQCGGGVALIADLPLS